MDKKHNYPKTRKAAKPVMCPVCGEIYKARGIKIHLRMIHGVEYVELVKDVEGPPKALMPESPANVNYSDETLVDLLNQLEEAHQQRKAQEYSLIVDKIAKVRARMGWSTAEIAREADENIKNFRILEAEMVAPPKGKRLVVMFEDGRTRAIDTRDYEEVSHWINELQEIKVDFKQRIQRYKDVPALLKIEQELGW